MKRETAKFLTILLLIFFLACTSTDNTGGQNGGDGDGDGNGSQALQNLNFGAPNVVEAGDVSANAQLLVVDDFNQDQQADVAVANNGIRVFLGDGSGNLTNPTDNTTDGIPNALTHGELGAGANTELAAATANNMVSILVDQDGDGTFGPAENFLAGANPRGIAIADFDGDGNGDVVTVNAADNSITVKFGAGDISFPQSVDFASGGKVNSPRNLIAVDLDNDGDIDLAIVNFGNDRVVRWINSGNPDRTQLFPAANADDSLALPAGSGAQGIYGGDFNKDGAVDLAVPNPTPKNVSFFLNQGNGNFNAATLLPAGFDAFAATANDFNLDGNMDLAVCNAFGQDGAQGDVGVYLGKGDGTFDPPKNFTTGVNAASLNNDARSIATGDFNNDGKPDIITANSLAQTLAILLNTSN